MAATGKQTHNPAPVIRVEELPAAPAEIHFDITKTAALELGRLVDGNGLKSEQVRLSKHDTAVHVVHGGVTVKLVPVLADKKMKGKKTAGETAASRADALQKAQAAGDVFLASEGVQALIEQAIARDAADGWAMPMQKIPLRQAAHKEYAVVERCVTCSGAGKYGCQKCAASGKCPCPQCQGQGRTPCPRCNGTGQMNNEDGSRSPCVLCQGAGGQPCMTCQTLKVITCPNCNGTGLQQCKDCDATGFCTHIYTAEYTAELHFDISRETLPADAQVAIEALGLRNLALESHAEIFRTRPLVSPEAYVLPFHAYLPLAVGEFSIEGKFFPATVAGLQGKIIKIDPVLDRVVKPGINALVKLSKGPMAADALIAQAARYRLIRTALAGLAHAPKRAVYQKIMREYPMVLSDKYAKAAIKYAHLALLTMAQGPRRKGLLIGTGIAAVISAAYFVTSARTALRDVLRQAEKGQHILLCDLAVWMIGYGLCVWTIKSLAAKRINRILPAGAEGRGMPAAGEEGLYALLTTFVTWLLIAAAAPQKPEWLVSILKMAGIMAG